MGAKAIESDSGASRQSVAVGCHSNIPELPCDGRAGYVGKAQISSLVIR
jgi:hypothetical protein